MGNSLSPFWCLCQKLFSVLFYTLIKLCYTKALEWSSLVPGPEAKSSLEIMNPTLITLNSQGSCHPQTVRVLVLFQSGLNSIGESGHPCLPSDFIGNASIFHHWGNDNVCCGFVVYGFYYVEVWSFYACFLESFIINGCWTLTNTFSASIEIIISFLPFSLLIWCITLIDLQILENPCIPGIKPNWSWCMIFSICCWILLFRILLRIFAGKFWWEFCWGYSSVILAGSLLFLWHLCKFFVLGWWWPHRMSLEVYLLLQFSEEFE